MCRGSARNRRQAKTQARRPHHSESLLPSVKALGSLVAAVTVIYFVPVGHADSLKAERVPDSIKVYVTEGRMVRVTGQDIAQCIAESNLATVTEEVEGEEILKLGGAADGGGRETADTGGIKGTWDTQVTVVRSLEETGSTGAGEYCLKVDGPRTDRTDDSGIQRPSTRFKLPGNSRFRFTCKVYCEEQRDQFALALLGDGRFLTSLHSGQIWAKNADDTGEYFQNTPGEWTQFNGILTTLDEGDREYQLWIHHDMGGPLTWYLDDIAIVPLRTESGQVAYRTKSAAESELTLASLNANRVNLYNRGALVPMGIENVAADGGLLPETVITFWGDPPRSRDGGDNVFTPENTYVLTFASPDPPKRYRLAPLAPRQGNATVIRSYRRTLRIEEDNHLQYYQQYDGPPTDRVMWASFKAPPWEPEIVTVPPIVDIDEEGSDVGVRAFLWGWSDLPLSPDHFWKLTLNGVPIGQAEWEGPRHHIVEGMMPHGRLRRDRANELAVEQTNPQLQLDLMSLDWIELDYEARLLPLDDFLEFTVEPVANPRYAQTAATYSGRGVRVFVEGSDAEQRPATYSEGNRHGIEVPLTQTGGRYRAVGPAGFAKPTRLAMGYESRLRQLDRVPEYLIVSHTQFLEALRPLVDARVEQGLNTLVVDVEDVYDEYSDGLFDPDAIRLFVDDLLRKQDEERPSLQYLWLVGDATYDYMGIRAGSRNYVPTHHTDDVDILPTYSPTIAHDNYFAFGPGTGAIPLAAVGRLPATSIETVQGYVAKVLEYERHVSADDPWLQRAVLISSKDFNGFSNDTASNLLAGWSIDNLTGTGDREGDIQLRDAIVQSIGSGCGIVTFTGHGAYYVWRTGENMNDQRTDMMTDREINQLTNRGEYPIVFAATCFSALFDAPIHGMSRADSGVGIYFVQALDKGAVALIGHVGKVDVAAGHQFNRAVLQGLIGNPGSRLGDHFVAAKRRFPDPAFSGVALIGDPALIVTLE